jgi:Flp pilus assembly protein TadD
MSLLLDALKKAALEKQRREQTNAQTINTAPPVIPPEETGRKEEPKKSEAKTEDKNVEIEQIPQENTSTTAVTIAATKMDLGQLNPELEALSIAQPHQPQTSDIENGLTSDNLVFDISEIDPTYLEPVAEQNIAPEVLPGTGIVEEFVRRANREDNASDLSLVAEEPGKPVSDLPDQPFITPIHVNQVDQSPAQKNLETASTETHAHANKAAQLAPKTADNPLYTEDIKALFDGKGKPVEMFSASAGKEALAQLLARSKKAANGARQRMMLMYAFLSVTAILMVAFYYYLLHSEAPTVVALVPEAPVSAAESIENSENTPVIAATEPIPETDAGDSTQEDVTADSDAISAIDPMKSEADAVTGSLTAGLDQNANRRSEQNGKQAEPQSAVRARSTEFRSPKPARNSENHQVLPAETIPRQAMIVELNPAVNEVSEAIDRGYKAYQRGDISAAQEAYQEALRQDPHQRDAMLGAAAVAVRQGRQQEALKIYQQRLARDPKDQYAQSGILSLSENAGQNPELDSELSRLLLEYPEAAHLHFLKGSLFAARQEWAAAQVSFFEAWQRDNKNPDLAFNLGVALDHLAQPKEAARFYRQALALGNSRPASFSVNAIQRRLQDLEGAGFEGSAP